jgi:hypothetical protein
MPTYRVGGILGVRRSEFDAWLQQFCDGAEAQDLDSAWGQVMEEVEQYLTKEGRKGLATGQAFAGGQVMRQPVTRDGSSRQKRFLGPNPPQWHQWMNSGCAALVLALLGRYRAGWRLKKA